MRSMHKTLGLFLLAAITISASTSSNINNLLITKGRTDLTSDNKIVLVGPASSVTYSFEGEKSVVTLQSKDKYGHHELVAIELDGQYYGRFRVNQEKTNIPVTAKKHGIHTVTIYKATEAGVGPVLFDSVEGDIVKTKQKKKKKIEFIGDSITCGMGNDIQEIPCGTGQWFDQHNAYYSYAPITARALDADFVLSSVSGIGMYRNWNDEHQNEAIMPDVYENLYLSKDNNKPYTFGFNQDITCIALGTNDFSNGDGKKERLPFNEDKYVNNYIEFIKTVYKHAPNTQVVLLDSPMVKGEKEEVFIKCLNRVAAAFSDEKKPVLVFNFSDITPHGCSYHPEIEDDKKMAAELTPFLKKLL